MQHLFGQCTQIHCKNGFCFCHNHFLCFSSLTSFAMDAATTLMTLTRNIFCFLIIGNFVVAVKILNVQPRENRSTKVIFFQVWQLKFTRYFVSHQPVGRCEPRQLGVQHDNRRFWSLRLVRRVRPEGRKEFRILCFRFRRLLLL